MKLAPIVALLLAGGAAAQDLAILAEDPERGYTWLMKTDRVERTTRGATIWVYFYSKRPSKLGKLSYMRSVAQWGIDCDEKSYSIGVSNYYDGNDDLVGSSSGSIMFYSPAVPDTVADHIVRASCSQLGVGWKR